MIMNVDFIHDNMTSFKVSNINRDIFKKSYNWHISVTETVKNAQDKFTWQTLLQQQNAILPTSD